MIIDVFTYSNASPDAAYTVEELIDAAKNAGLDGVCHDFISVCGKSLGNRLADSTRTASY